MVSAETHAVLAQHGAGGLVERLDLLGHFLAFEHAERFDKLVGDAARDAGDVLGFGNLDQRAEQLLDMSADPQVEARLRGVARRAGELLVGENAHARPQDILARHDDADHIAGPADMVVESERELLVGRLRQTGRARLDFPGERLLGDGMQGLGLRAAGRRIGHETESLETADDVPLDRDFTGFRNFTVQCRVLSQTPH
ncbi:MAG: hypothetical protein GHHEDOFH_01138 [Pseudorhodoplanes sp.]|nr:hypothetical protein [Pseudorhodoplanes sp.]